MEVRIGCVVEGHAEVASVPVLIRRIAAEMDSGLFVHIPQPVRMSRNRVGERFGDVERRVKLAAAKAGSNGAVLVLLDSDNDCPKDLAPALLRRAMGVGTPLPVGVVLAKQEFEAWFLASAESLRGKRGLPVDLEPPLDPESVRGAKEWLSARTSPKRPYKNTRDQPALTEALDISKARARSPSFDKCYREVTRLLTLLRQPETPLGPKEPTS